VRRAAVLALVCAGAAVGVLAEQQAYDWADLRGWLPDLLAGWTLIGLGIALLALRRSRGAAVLLLLAGFSWFAFNFETTGPAAVQWLGAHAAFFHRGALFHLALALPTGRPRTRLAAGGVALAWTGAILWPLWNGDGGALVLCAALTAVAVVGYRTAPGWRSRAIAGRGLAAVALLAAAIGADAARSIAGSPQGVTDLTVLGYQVAVAVAGAVLFGAALFDAPAALAERAVALERGDRSLRDALRDLLGDPGLEVGFSDGGGRPSAAAAGGQLTTPVTVTGRQVGVVIHDPAALDDAATRSAVLAAVGLAAERDRLRAEVGRQVDAVEASRRRLLVAEEEERRRLAERLDHGPGAALAAVDRLVRETSLDLGGGDLADALARASDQLARVRPEVDTLVRGLGGVGPDGLVPALERLAVGLPIELELDDVALSAETASALWFVCSESLANALKHAGARSIKVTLERASGAVRLSVEDDGRGGADPSGAGLIGLGDRIAALSGRLTVVSPLGAGTTVAVELPNVD
jgi:signal transduction histidine kinase